VWEYQFLETQYRHPTWRDLSLKFLNRSDPGLQRADEGRLPDDQSQIASHFAGLSAGVVLSAFSLLLIDLIPWQSPGCRASLTGTTAP
jgi:hypothetical protein